MHLHICVGGFKRRWGGSNISSFISNLFTVFNQMKQWVMSWIACPAPWFLVEEASSLLFIQRSQTKDPRQPLVTAISQLVIGYLSDCLQEGDAVFIWRNYQEKWGTIVCCSSRILLVQVSKQSKSAEILQTNHRDYFIWHLAGNMLIIITCKWSNCANATHNSLAVLWHRRNEGWWKHTPATMSYQ